MTQTERKARWRARRTPEQIQAEKDYKVRWRAANPDAKLQHGLAVYGLSIADYDRMLAECNHKCTLCGAEVYRAGSGKSVAETACVDHDHSTNLVRGILCAHCNKALGLFKDNPDILRKAADYLEYSGVTI